MAKIITKVLLNFNGPLKPAQNTHIENATLIMPKRKLRFKGAPTWDKLTCNVGWDVFDLNDIPLNDDSQAQDANGTDWNFVCINAMIRGMPLLGLSALMICIEKSAAQNAKV